MAKKPLLPLQKGHVDALFNSVLTLMVTTLWGFYTTLLLKHSNLKIYFGLAFYLLIYGFRIGTILGKLKPAPTLLEVLEAYIPSCPLLSALFAAFCTIKAYDDKQAEMK